MKRIIYTLFIVAMVFAPHIPFFGVTVANAALRDNMNAWWEMNESSGNIVDSHNSNDMTNTNTIAFASGKVGNAAEHERDVANQYFTIGDTADMSITGDISFAFWFEPETLTGEHYIMSKSNTNANNTYNIRVNGQKIFVNYKNPSNQTTEIQSDNDIITTTGTFYCVVMAIDVSVPSATLWIDASSVNITFNASAATSIKDTDADFTIGAKNDAGDIINETDGLLDEVSIYGGLLVQADADKYCNSGSGISYADSADVVIVPKRFPSTFQF